MVQVEMSIGQLEGTLYNEEILLLETTNYSFCLAIKHMVDGMVCYNQARVEFRITYRKQASLL